ncbi:uncharacterized protein LOC126576901 [Anopheles aquasalis]|uniref:uncharacterized protein LOC126576901 n=1 Tax=Anopheles aquasalis TaxID=42839 RepID=UPI00215AA59B|nr:uncharacterized protein LOC126576901 [Anopheles aquasalis]
MDKWLNVWQYLVALSRLVISTIVFFVQHRWLRFWPPRERPLVTVRQGKVRGISSILPNGKPYHYFKGIPYATAPVGELRFRAPVPLDRFRVPIVDCCVERADYVQLDFFTEVVFGAESALYLNVYTPVQQLPVESNGTRLPVMVFLHGGGFACGTASSLFYAPDYFLQRNVIVVTVYYRLGPLGFLYLPEAGIEGNAGLKDQLMALRWVNENIAQFGGDPQCVTLFGESAGSFSSYLHMLSPNSRKYFHRVICQSGVVCSSSFMQKDGVKMAFNLARYFGYEGTTQKGALETLLKVPARQLAKHQRKALDKAEKHNDLVFVFLPVVEKTHSNDSIITQEPEQMIKTYDTLRIPLLEGCNDGEGILGLFIMRNQFNELAQLPNRLASKIFRTLPPEEISRISERIKRFYFGDEPVDRWDREQLKHLLSDTIFMTDSWINAELLARYQPLLRHYHYRFTYDGRFSILKRFYRNTTTPGACHGDELMYMFCPRALPKLPPTSDERRVRDNVVALWTSFAKHGDPSVESRDVVDDRWDPVPKIYREATEFRLNCLEINVRPVMVPDPCVERRNFWRCLLLVVGVMDKWLNVCPYLVALARLVIATIVFLVQHRWLRFWPPRERPLVTVRQGKVRGISSILPNGKPYHYFKGIPYATAPVGELRFRAPVPLDRFRVPIVDCCVERADYVQLDFFSGLVFGAESALYLNVYTPVQQLPVESNGTRLPVMVFLHGGGFACGTASSLFYAPDYFLQRNVIVVTVYYRLGPLGFLYLPEAGIEGNAGLKDQLMALRWVNENIAQFGGDPQCVTLLGESAGSFSSYLHMLSPNSRKYFHRVICQSGVVCSSSFMQTDGVKMAFNLARYFGYEGTSQQGALETLLKVPAEQLAKHQRKALGKAAKHSDLVFVFLPVVEQTLSNDSIITQEPEQILKTYDTLRIPLLEGCNDGEGILGLFIMRNQFNELAQLPNRLASKIFRALLPEEISRISERIKRFYFGDEPVGRWDREQLKHLLSDTIFMTDSWINAELLARYQPLLRHYHYRFTYDGRFSILKRLFMNARTSGACHGDDLMYMFCPRALPKLPPTSDEHRVRDNVIALWTSFAKHGDPSVESRDVVDDRWEPVPKIDREATEFRLNCLEINVRPVMVPEPCVERRNFWRSLYETSVKG